MRYRWTGVDIPSVARQHKEGWISMYRAYRDRWKKLEVRQPGIALLLRAAAVMLGFLLAALLTDSLNVGILVGAAIGVTIAASATGYRRRTRRSRIE